ncbi:unnamed protein product [Diamesa hyperborea]
MKAIKLSPVTITLLTIGGVLSIVATLVASSLNNKSEVLDSKSQDKANGLSSLDRVKAIYDSPKIKKDLISDEETQNLLTQSGNQIQEYPPKPLPKVENKDVDKGLADATKQNNNPEQQKNEPCNAYDESLKRCKMPASYNAKVQMVSDNISKNTKETLSDAKVDGTKVVDANYIEMKLPPDNYKSTPESKEINQSNKIKIEDDSPLGLLIATASTTTVLKGRSISIGGASNQIKAGTTVLAVLNEAKTITSSGETYASASIIGAPFDHQKFPEGVTLLLKMKLNSTQDGIEGVISSCSSRRNSDKSIACAGQLEDISGASALRGEVYSSTGWQIVTTAATTFLAGLSLSKMTTSATQLGTTVDQTAANALYQSLSGAITSMGTQIASSFARSGTQISIPGRVVVRVLFTQDSVW